MSRDAGSMPELVPALFLVLAVVVGRVVEAFGLPPLLPGVLVAMAALSGAAVSLSSVASGVVSLAVSSVLLLAFVSAGLAGPLWLVAVAAGHVLGIAARAVLAGDLSGWSPPVPSESRGAGEPQEGEGAGKGLLGDCKGPYTMSVIDHSLAWASLGS